MSEKHYRYIIVGAGLAGVSAIKGIREMDTQSEILLINGEPQRPYHRPPLSKGLWLKKTKYEEVFQHDERFFISHNVKELRDIRAVSLKARQNVIQANDGGRYHYERLLLATGGVPTRLDIPGADLPAVLYYRDLGQYIALNDQLRAGMKVTVIGGGFIGSEMAAALASRGVAITMIFPEEYICSRVFPQDLGRAVTTAFEKKGVRILSGDVPTEFRETSNSIQTFTRSGERVWSDVVIVGIGIVPALDLAAQAGLRLDQGIVVDQFTRTTDPGIFAAGDNARFPYLALNMMTRIEHWDHARAQGRCAGGNMAGKEEPYSHMPYFYSDLFEFGYEAVGDVNARLETAAVWDTEFHTGVVYYLKGNQIRGVMFCNVWDQLDRARDWIRRGAMLSDVELKKIA